LRGLLLRRGEGRGKGRGQQRKEREGKGLKPPQSKFSGYVADSNTGLVTTFDTADLSESCKAA